MLKNIIIFTVTIVFFACAGKKEKADAIYYNARVYTVDSAFSVVEALVVKDGKVLATGSTEDMLSRYEAGQKTDLNGLTVYPGFIDAHCHFTGYATDMWKCDLTGTGSFKEVIKKVKDYAETAPMYWIYGRGWDQNDWETKAFPDKTELDILFPDRPVFLKRIDGHAAVANQKALDLCGVNEKTTISGGSIEKKNGRLTGLLIDNAMDLVDQKIPLVADSLAKKYFLKAQDVCFGYGLTMVHDCGISENTVRLVEESHRAGQLKMKIYALLNDDSTYYDRWIRKGIYKTALLTVGGFKLYADGALGSRGACLLHPYSDKPGWSGFLLRDERYLKNVAQKLADSELQLCTHAIGDSANRQILRAYASALEGKNQRRWRVEHAQVMNEQDFIRFSEFDIIPSVQPTHATSDMYWAVDRVGPERIKNAYAYRKLLNIAGLVALGTDFPVEDISTIKTFYAAVVRKDAKGYPDNGFQAENALSREEAIRGMTIWAAYASFSEKEKGSLEPGKVADFIVLDNDLVRCVEEKIPGTKVVSTFIDGVRVFSRDEKK